MNDDRRIRRDLDIPRPEVVSFEDHEAELERQRVEAAADKVRRERGLEQIAKIRARHFGKKAP